MFWKLNETNGWNAISTRRLTCRNKKGATGAEALVALFITEVENHGKEKECERRREL